MTQEEEAMTDFLHSGATRLVQLTIENFRGVRDQISLEFDASAIILTGANGTGKTSVFDALQWLLVDDVSRLAEFKLRRNEEYLVNVFSPNELARVEATFDINNAKLHVRRVGNSSGSTLEVTLGSVTHTGADADGILYANLIAGDLSLNEVLATSGLLQQDDLRQLLRTRPEQRYQQLLRLLGLQILEEFDGYAGRMRDASRMETRRSREILDRIRSEFEHADERLKTVQIQAELKATRQLDTDSISSAAETLKDILLLNVGLDSIEQVAAFGAAMRNASDSLAKVNDQLRRIPESVPEVPESLPDEIASAISIAKNQLELFETEFESTQKILITREQSQDELSRLATAAIPLLSTHDGLAPCPVCLTMIDAGRVAAELYSRSENVSSVVEARTSAASAEIKVQESKEALTALGARQDRVAIDLRVRRDANATLRQLLQSLIQASSETLTPYIEPTPQLSGLLDAIRNAMRGPSESIVDSWSSLRADVVSVTGRLIEGISKLADAAYLASAEASAAQLAVERSVALPRERALHDQLLTKLTSQENSYESARRAETLATLLAQSTTAAATEIFRERFAVLEPLVNDIYARLDPHPAFTRLNIRVETYRAKGTATPSVIDDEVGIEANPMVVFSSAQANIVALSIFLALGLASGDRRLPFVLLDDPLQSLDDVNVLGFADLSRRLRRQRQLIIATHEERFAELLERKLTGRYSGEDLIVHRFIGWNRGGPIVKTDRIDFLDESHSQILT